MKKLKIGFGEGGFQGFMARHVEKCVLTAVIVLMAYFIYSGSSTKVLDDGITQQTLQDTAQRADQNISNSSFQEVIRDREPKDDVDRKAREQTIKVDSRRYAYRIWDSPLVPRLTPRMDPNLYAPERLVVTPLIGPLVLMPPETATDDELPVDPLLRYEQTLGGSGSFGGYGGDASTPMPTTSDDEKPKAKSRREREKEREKGPGGYPSYYSQDGKSNRRSKRGNSDSPYGDYPAPPTTGSSMYGATGTKTRTIPPEATIGVKASQGSILQPRTAMVITASVPFAKQWEEFRAAFKDAPGGQDPARDIPTYLGVWVDRLDVTDDPSIDPATAPDDAWVRVSLTKLKAIEDQYGAVINEIADVEAVDEPRITRPVPPFLLTDLMPVLLHPDVPRASLIDPELEEEIEDPTMDFEGGELEIDGGDGSDGPRSMSPRGGGYGNYPRSAGPRGSAAGRGYGSPRMTGSSRGNQRMPRSPYGGEGRMPRGSAGGSGADFETYRPVAKKLVRFVDFEVEQGHKYRYRIQLVLEDPNRPQDPQMAPELSTLDDKSRDRLKAIEVADAKWEKEKGRTRRTYYRATPWSEASGIVSVPSTEKFFAGETIPPSTVPINGAEVQTNEPQAKVLTVKWDEELGIYAPAEQTVYRAAVLNTKADVEFLHPVLTDLRKIPDYTLDTDGLVLDMHGGDNLPGSTDSKERQRAPGETLIMDSEGNLFVTDEARDVEGYRKFIFPEPKEDPMANTTGEGTLDSSMAPPMGTGGYPGSKPGKGPRYPGGRSSRGP